MIWRIPVATITGFTLFFHGCFGLERSDQQSEKKQKDLDALCRHLMVQDEPSEDVAYVGGITADGEAVPPVDLNPAPPGTGLPMTIRLPILMNSTPFLGDFMGKNPNNTKDLAVLGDTEVGAILYNTQTNTMTLNGHPITSAQEGALKRICQKKHGKKTNPVP